MILLESSIIGADEKLGYKFIQYLITT